MSERSVTAVILAGGRGTRIAAYRNDVPKPLLPVCGKPVLTHQIEALREEGVRDILLVTGHMAEQIEACYGDGADFGVRIRYYREPEPLGTAGALFRLDLRGDFLLLNGDMIFSFDLHKMLAFHRERRALATVFAHPNTHPADSTLLETDETGKITGLFMKEDRPALYDNLCCAGIEILSPALFGSPPAAGKAHLERDVLLPAVGTGRLFAYKSSEYVKDMGTPARLRETEADLLRGLVQKKKSALPQRAVFLDRDGTLNEHRGYIARPEDLVLLPGAAEAVGRINRLGYLAVLVTNQPVVARGGCTPEELRTIHKRLQVLLGEKGAFLDGIYVCPHHPDRGFPGENPAFKTDCACRKPKPGLLLRAAADLHIDLSASYMAGDTDRDVQTARNAGCVPVLLTDAPGAPDDGVLRYGCLDAFARTLGPV